MPTKTDVATQTARKKIADPAPQRKPTPNGKDSLDLNHLLYALQAMRVGDFSVRMAGDQLGIEGKIADTFNEIVAANERMAQAARAGRPGGRPRGQDPPARAASACRAAPGATWRSSVNTLIDDLLWPTTRSDARDRRGRAGRPAADRAARRRRPAAQGRVPALGQHRQHDDQAAQRVHLGGDARRARGRHRRQARRPGAGAAK